MDMQALELGEGTMEGGRKSHVFSLHHVWMAGGMCIIYLGKRWHQDAVWEEGKSEQLM